MDRFKGNLFFEFLMMGIGAAIAAFAIQEFLVPCTILDGGVIGIGIMISNLTGFPLGILTLILNVPFLVFGAKKLGQVFIVKSAYSMLVFSAFTSLFEPMQAVTSEYLLAVCFGGVILGAGVGLVIRYGGCLDGTETVALLLNRKYKMPVGQTVLFFNIAIYTIAGFLFGFDRAMYSLLTYFITSKVLDYVESGMEQAKAAFIITDDSVKVAELIYEKLGRTVTIMEGEGLVSGKKVVLYCVINRMEVRDLRNLVNSIDASSFVTITDVSEIIGTHMKRFSRIQPDTEQIK